MEESFELELGNLTMDAYEKRFIELITYADYIKYEKIKIQIFLSVLQPFYRDNMHYDMPRLLKN